MKSFSEKINVFHGKYLPERNVPLAGYANLMYVYDLQVPLPETLSFISEKYTRYQRDNWLAFTPRHAPEPSLYGHLSFAMQYEGIDLSVLKALFDKIVSTEIVAIVQNQPTGSYSRRIWFLYEYLKNIHLDLPDATRGAYIPILNEALQYAGPARRSKRHRVTNNLPGVPAFCPLIRRTEQLDKFIGLKLGEQAKKLYGEMHRDILMRASAFLLLKDSKASYKIEGEVPAQNRAERWGRAIGQAGQYPLTEEELCRLQEMVIEDHRFVYLGLRSEGGFIGEHERSTGSPLPDHISARWQDLEYLIAGLIETSELLKDDSVDAVLAAAIIGFGFVFIHPFADGNGRIHRYLLHHMLAQKHFSGKGIVFPISTVILENIMEYKAVLESYSQPRLEFIKWHATEDGNVSVENETIDLYRYFDATKQAEFLYQCVNETVINILPDEINYLQKYDSMKNFIINFIDMPDRIVDLLIRLLNQNNGKLSQPARENEFKALKIEEIELIESKYAELYTVTIFK